MSCRPPPGPRAAGSSSMDRASAWKQLPRPVTFREQGGPRSGVRVIHRHEVRDAPVGLRHRGGTCPFGKLPQVHGGFPLGAPLKVAALSRLPPAIAAEATRASPQPRLASRPLPSQSAQRIPSPLPIDHSAGWRWSRSGRSKPQPGGDEHPSAPAKGDGVKHERCPAAENAERRAGHVAVQPAARCAHHRQ